MSEPRERDQSGRFLKRGANDRFEVDVWRIEDGEHIKKLWDATQEEVDEVQEQYGDDMAYDIVVKQKD
jgi:predicted SnoaL-like aldol condensation-catalyzing enzyme